jgi:hypothetical protein
MHCFAHPVLLEWEQSIPWCDAERQRGYEALLHLMRRVATRAVPMGAAHFLRLASGGSAEFPAAAGLYLTFGSCNWRGRCSSSGCSRMWRFDSDLLNQRAVLACVCGFSGAEYSSSRQAVPFSRSTGADLTLLTFVDGTALTCSSCVFVAVGFRGDVRGTAS